MKLEQRTQTVYFAPTARRTYITKKGASIAEARARITKKYPPERDEPEGGGGWHWRYDMPNAEKLLKRYARLIFRSA